jgi:hypothetical protein
MTPPDLTKGVESVYNFWLGLVPQFLGPLASATQNKPGKSDAGVGGNNAGASLDALAFPAEQFAMAASMTQQSLQAFAQSVAPMLQGASSNLLDQWATALPWLAPGKLDQPQAANAATAAAQAMLAPWSAFMSSAVGTSPSGPAAAPRTSPSAATSVLPLQAMSQAWIEWSSRLAGATPAQLTTAFERTYGALSDALGLGPARQLHAAWEDMMAAGVAQQEARANYAVLLQRAFARGLQRLAAHLAEKADAGERVDSVLALLRLWAISTEEIVHETLQSEAGLAATAALTRSAIAYRKRMQHVVVLMSDQFGVATRHDLDEAYREIQELKRELRRSRPSRGPLDTQTKRAHSGKTRARGKGKATTSPQERTP